MLRRILAVILGFVVANLIIFAVELASHAIYPPPAGLDLNDPAAVRAAMAKMPAAALWLVLVAGAVGTASGAWLATRVSRQATFVPGLVVGGLITVAAIANVAMIPHPTWFRILSPTSILLAACAGVWIARQMKKSGGGSEAC